MRQGTTMQQGNGNAGQEQAWLAQAIDLATGNVASGGGPFGALIVRGDEVISEGINRVVPMLDPTAHAEVVAIREACQKLGGYRLNGCVLVSSCEPCPLCLSAALWARIDRVLYTADRDNAALAGFDDRAFYDLFSQPRQDWPMLISHIDTPGRTVPFDAWLTKSDRTEY